MLYVIVNVHLIGLKQLIEEPIPVCTNSESSIYQILVSDHEKVCQSGVLSVGISVHVLTYCTRKVNGTNKIQFEFGLLNIIVRNASYNI